MKRKITIIVGIAIIIGGFYGSKMIMGSKKDKKVSAPKSIATVFTSLVSNKTISIRIKESGRLVAKRKADLYAEVQGIMEPSSKDFKAGVRFKKGEKLVKIRGNDTYANLLAKKSELQNLITSILPDLRLDYPDAYTKWSAYMGAFDIEKSIKPLPPTATDKEKYFITGKNIYTAYYNTKNLEIIQSKYIIRAPFNGILTEALINPGTVVRPGQKLGEIIDPSNYELEVAISQSLIHSVSPGKKVKITNPNDRSISWIGTVARVNGKVDPTTQTIKIFISVRGKKLYEGVYLEAEITGEELNDVYEIERKLLIEGKNIYGVENNSLILMPVEIVHKTAQTVLVRGLKNGTEVASKIIPGAFEGMEVEVINEN